MVESFANIADWGRAILGEANAASSVGSGGQITMIEKSGENALEVVHIAFTFRQMLQYRAELKKQRNGRLQ